MRHIVGIDAGGSKTLCCLADERGNVLASSHGGPANRNFVSLKSAESAIEGSVAAILRSHGGPVETVVLTGAHVPPASTALITRCAKTESVTVVDEFEACLAAGVSKTKRWGVVIVSGTGSFCKGRNSAGAEGYAGGWGPLIGDEGSAYDIAREALFAIARAGDGRGKKTSLEEFVFPHLGIDSIRDLRKRLYKPPIARHELASVAICVSAAAEAGDEVGRRILVEAGRRLAQLASPVVRRLFGPDERFPVVMAGGVLRGSRIVADALAAKMKGLRPKAHVFAPALRPILGAVIIGLQSIGITVDSGVRANLRKGNSRI